MSRHRERLDLTDPPVAALPRSHPIDSLRGVLAVISALAIIALLAADTARPAPPNLAPTAQPKRRPRSRRVTRPPLRAT